MQELLANNSKLRDGVESQVNEVEEFLNKPQPLESMKSQLRVLTRLKIGELKSNYAKLRDDSVDAIVKEVASILNENKRPDAKDDLVLADELSIIIVLFLQSIQLPPKKPTYWTEASSIIPDFSVSAISSNGSQAKSRTYMGSFVFLSQCCVRIN